MCVVGALHMEKVCARFFQSQPGFNVCGRPKGGLGRLRPVARSLGPRALKACVKLSFARAQACLAKA